MARSLLRRPRLQVHTLAVVALAVLAGQATGSQTQVMLKEDAQADLDALFRESVARGDVPSVVAVVANRQEVLYRGAFGALDETGAVDIHADAIFNIASMTKPVTSVGVMMLHEEGLVELDDPVSSYLPEWEAKEVLAELDPSTSEYTTRAPTRPVTIRHLLTHTSGLGYDFSDPAVRALTQSATESDSARRFSDWPLAARGESRSY